MNCDMMKSQGFPYVDGELPAALRDEMEAHFAECDSCRHVVEQELAFRDAYVVRLRPDPTPPHLRDRINHFLTGLVEQSTGYTLVSEIGVRACHVCHAPNATFEGASLESFLRL